MLPGNPERKTAHLSIDFRSKPMNLESHRLLMPLSEESCAWEGRNTLAKEQAWESSTTRSRGFPRDLVLSDQPTAHQCDDGGNQPDELDEQADPVGDVSLPPLNIPYPK